MFPILIALFGLLLWAHPAAANMRFLQAATSYCPNATTSYRLFVIDGAIMDNYTNCSYMLNLTSGNCSLDTVLATNTSNKYICYNASSSVCDSIDPLTVIGFATRKCGDNYTVEALAPVSNMQLTQEFTITSSFVDVRAAIGFVCNATSGQSTSSWYPRNCTLGGGTVGPGGSAGTGTSYASALHLGLALAVVAISLFLLY